MPADGKVFFDLAINERIPAQGGSSAGVLIHTVSEFLTANISLTGTGTPNISAVWSRTISLSGGAATIDLTALVRDDPIEQQSFNGLNVVAWAFAGAVANANPIAVLPGASNPYDIFGTASDRQNVYPGQIVMGCSQSAFDLEAVSATEKEIDFSGTAAQQIHCILAAGS